MSTFIMDYPNPTDHNAMDDFQKIMDALSAAAYADLQKIAAALEITEGQAADIQYLRTRSRWTQTKEDYLVWCFKNGHTAPDIMSDFDVPCEYQSRFW